MSTTTIKTHTVRDMFNFWVRNKRKDRPYLTVKYPGKRKNSELWYKVKQEINYLEQELLNFDAEIQQLEYSDKDISRFTTATHEIYRLKQETYNTKERIKELKKYPPDEEIKLMDYHTFRDVIYAYNKQASEEVIQGEILNLNEKLGYLYILKVNRIDKSINWGESNAFKAELISKGITPKDKDNPEGDNWLVFHNSRYYLRWAWKKAKGICKVKNNTVYGFYPTQKSTKGVMGTRALLAEANNKNPLLHLKYISK